MKKQLADLIHIIHFAVLLFILTGWACPSSGVLKTHAFLIPILILHWKTNNNTCYLTNLEDWLRDRDVDQGEKEGRFIRHNLERFCRVSPSDSTLEACIYLVMIGLMSVSFFRLGWL